jgi:nucleotide-binding universal stress UspA family protein
MTSTGAQRPDAVHRVLFPTDLRADGIPAFCHALRLGLAGGGLTLLHVGVEGEWNDFPGVRDTLIRWGLVPPGSSRNDLLKIGLRVHKVKVDVADPVRGIVNRIEHGEYDLVVITTHRRSGLQRWMRPSVAWGVARRVGVPCLLVPPTPRAFVDLRTGEIRLQRVLLPVTDDRIFLRALDHVERMAATLGISALQVRALHVGTGGVPEFLTPQGWEIEVTERTGDVVSVIEEEAAHCDLVALASRGLDSWTDVVFGSTTQRLLERVSIPVLTVPVPEGTP